MKRALNSFSMKIAAKSLNESYARYAVSSFISQLDPTLEEIADIRTVISEAVTNCVIHAYKEQDGEIYIAVKYYDDRTIKIKIKDRGCGIADIVQAMQPFYTGDPCGERGGMGFTIMSTFTDKLTVKSILGKGTTLTITKKLSKR